jgi:hypothetical protein
MMQQGRWLRRLGAWTIAVVALATGQGCLSFVNPLDAPPKDQIARGEMIPLPCRSRVHIFLIHGMDPLDFANLSGMTEYIHQLGYSKTYYGQLYHLWEFKNDIIRIHERDPQARFVVIGFSFGANVSRELVNAVKDKNIVIDLLIYLGGNTLENTPRTQPENVLRIANILATGCIWNGTKLDRAKNINYKDVYHFGSPTHRDTCALLAKQLAVVAARVPYSDKVPSLPPEIEEEIPSPRRVTPEQMQEMSSQLSPEWTFLSSRSGGAELPAPQPASTTQSSKRLPYSIQP